MKYQVIVQRTDLVTREMTFQVEADSAEEAEDLMYELSDGDAISEREIAWVGGDTEYVDTSVIE